MIDACKIQDVAGLLNVSYDFLIEIKTKFLHQLSLSKHRQHHCCLSFPKNQADRGSLGSELVTVSRAR